MKLTTSDNRFYVETRGVFRNRALIMPDLEYRLQLPQSDCLILTCSYNIKLFKLSTHHQNLKHIGSWDEPCIMRKYECIYYEHSFKLFAYPIIFKYNDKIHLIFKENL